MAVPALQLTQLAHQGRIQKRRVSDARLDQWTDERPSGLSIRIPVFPYMRGLVVVPDHGSGVLGHQQCGQRVDGQGSVAILAQGGTEGECEGLVLG